jgi:hypothetical protein
MTITELEPRLGYGAYSLANSPNGPVVAASPGDGWMIQATRKETGESWTDRVVAWLVHQNGCVVPAVVDEPESGGTWFPTQDDQFDVRIFHPAHPSLRDEEGTSEASPGDSEAG